MKKSYENEQYSEWTEAGKIVIQRKLEYETAFDGIVKIYRLKTNNQNLNLILSGKYFGDFIHFAKNGIFLRMFKSKTSWPKTRLVYIDYSKNKINIIKKTSSSYIDWKSKDIGNGRHTFDIKPNEKIEYLIL